MRLLVPAAATVGLGAAAWFFGIQHRFRRRWGDVPDGTRPAHQGGGPYREGAPVPRFLTRAPAPVERAALGALAAFELFLVCFCAFCFVIEQGTSRVAAVFAFWLWAPSVVAAVTLLRAGAALIAREPGEGARHAALAASWAALFYGLLLGALFGLLLLLGTVAGVPRASTEWMQVAALLLLLGGWPAIAAWQARALHQIAERDERLGL